ncbi:hypothetical protein G6011_07393 [Alternaria panax]|uniref:Uncharacterized protein n=1 Tax=Alternaria panax TaxID=48097 RepID=A0AAD4FGT7_9PLEO|nr:hypothetical protein G6011_07393 [Alternaria panax]
MNVPHYTSKTARVPDEKERSTHLNMHLSDTATHAINTVASARSDGGTDHHSRVANQFQPSTQLYSQQQHQARIIHPSHFVSSMAPPLPRQPTRAVGIAVNDLLPYCTTEPPLNEAQVIALSDIVGSLRELVVLALGAASGAAGCMEKLEGAVGWQAAGNIADFFADEWEIEG